MSMEQAKAFIEKMKTDEAFTARVLAVRNVAMRMDLINAEGFDFTGAELRAVVGELTEADLEVVVGGTAVGIDSILADWLDNTTGS